MLQLEERFYTLDEIADLTQTNRHVKLKRDACRKLKAWGYEYEWLDRRGVTIKAHQPTPEQRLKDLLVTRLNQNGQVDALGFAYFIAALSMVDGFSRMPWKMREKVLSDIAGRHIPEATQRHWASRLITTDNAMKGGKDSLWHTYTEDGRKIQERVELDDPQYKEYCAVRHATLEEMKKRDLSPSQQWGDMVKSLYGVYGTYYYCPALCLNALGADMDEMYDLIMQIIEQQNE